MTVEEIARYFAQRERGVQGAVGEYAILLPLVEKNGQLCLLFETRAATLLGHQPREVCFPGGRREAGESPAETALRETWEEVGIPSYQIELLAQLDVIQDISDRVIYPFLGRFPQQALEELSLNADEVKEVFCVPVDYLRRYPEEVYRYPVQVQVEDSFPYERIGFSQAYPWRSGWMEVPIYEYEGHFIWGMTGRMVRWFLQQLDKMPEA